MENPIKMDDLGGKPSIFGNIQVKETAGLPRMKGETETTTKKLPMYLKAIYRFFFTPFCNW